MGALRVLTIYDELSMSKAARERSWKAFLAGGTNHSGRALTLPYILNRCERDNVPYKLLAVPGLGYRIEIYPEASPK